MPDGEKKGITVRIDADLHAEVSQYLKDHGMTMAEFVSAALNDELHPKMNQKEGQNMEKMRTMAFQVPEDLFQKIKDYLHRNGMSQKEFVIGLIEREIERDLTEREAHSEAFEAADGQDEEVPAEQEENAAVGDREGVSDEDEEDEEIEKEDTESEDEEETEDEDMGPVMQM